MVRILLSTSKNSEQMDQAIEKCVVLQKVCQFEWEIMQILTNENIFFFIFGVNKDRGHGTMCGNAIQKALQKGCIYSNTLSTAEYKQAFTLVFCS